MSESLPTPDFTDDASFHAVTSKAPRQPLTLFFTGLPGAGKTTLARAVSKRLEEDGYSVRVWDGDEVRRTVSADLGFSREDRIENIRRMSGLAAESKEDISIVAAVSPSDAAREVARDVISEARAFLLVYVATPVEVCEDRDPKGLYARARSGEIENFTGISDPYEAPEDANLAIDTTRFTVDESVDLIFDMLRRQGVID